MHREYSVCVCVLNGEVHALSLSLSLSYTQKNMRERERERESKGGRLHYTMGLNEQEARGGSSLSSSPAQLHENIDLSSLSLEQEEALSVACEDASCPICLNDVPFVDTAILSCCRTQFCVHCILKWVLKKQVRVFSFFLLLFSFGGGSDYFFFSESFF